MVVSEQECLLFKILDSIIYLNYGRNMVGLNRFDHTY